MSIVTLVSGGLDSTLMALLTREEGIEQHPLFIDYGQLSRARESEACIRNFRRLRLPKPHVMDLEGFGETISSGLTDRRKRIFEDAFTPCRNLLFLTAAAAYAHQRQASAVAIGLLSERFSIFPDQTIEFLKTAETLLTLVLDRPLKVLAPLIELTKSDVVRLAQRSGIDQTYSCHAGGSRPCRRCIACREFEGVEG